MDVELAKYPSLVELAQAMLAHGADIEDVLEALRERSSSITQSMKVVRDVLSLPMDKAKDLVHHSRAWSDMRDEHAELHERAVAGMPEKPTQRAHGSFRVELDLTRSTTAET